MIMRVTQVVASYYAPTGGVELDARRIAKGCVEAGDDVTVLTRRFERSLVDEWIGAVRVRRFLLTVNLEIYPFSLSPFRHLRTHAADFHLVHVHSYSLGSRLQAYVVSDLRAAFLGRTDPLCP